MKRREFLRRTGLLLAAAATETGRPDRARAQDWPSGPVTLVVPFTPGGTTDILARAISDRLGEVLRKPVIVDNRPGAGGSIGAAAVARAKPDGQTLLVGHIGTLGVNPSLYPNLPYDPLKSFSYVAPLALVPNVLVVHPDVPARSVPELIEYAKANPGKLNYSSGGVGSAAHIAMAAFALAAKIDMVHVPYRGTAPSVTDVLGGQVQLTMTGTPAVLQHVGAGKLRALGVSTPARLRIAPDVPAISETIPGFEASQWYGVVAPAGTPEPILERLNADIRRIMNSPDVAPRLASEGAEPWDISRADFRAYVAREIRRWKAVIEAAKIEIK